MLAGELVWLTRARGWPVAEAVLRLLPGALMLLALRAALTGAGWPWVTAALIVSFPAHLADVWRR